MIILLLSTPRSGSHFYSEQLQAAHSGSIVLHELLSRASQGIYLEQQGHIELSSKTYHDMSYYEDLVQGQVVRVYSQRPDLEVFFDRLVDQAAGSDKTYILHEHVSLIPRAWIERLIAASSECRYLVRDRKEQLASRVIAGHTGVYIIRDNYMLCHGDITNQAEYTTPKFSKPIATEDMIKQLINIYCNADDTMQQLGVEFVNYQYLPNTSSTKKIFVSSFDRLSQQDQKLINRILDSD